MPTFRQTIDIRADRTTLFELTQDYERRLTWDPFLKEARLVGGAARPGVGARAWCVARSGLGMETEYVSYAPPNVAAVKMTHGPRLLASFAGSWRFERLGPGATRVVFTYHLATRPRWLRLVLEPFARWLFGRDTRKRLLALKRAAESGARQPASP